MIFNLNIPAVIRLLYTGKITDFTLENSQTVDRITIVKYPKGKIPERASYYAGVLQSDKFFRFKNNWKI